MNGAAPTLRDLYPDATVEAVLRTHRPPRLGLPARSWSNLVRSLAGLVVLILVGVWLLGLVVDPGTMNRWFGGSGVVTYDGDGDPNTLDGTWLKRAIWGTAAIAASAYALLRMALKPPWRLDRRVGWRRWAEERGFSTSSMHPDAADCFPPLRAGRDRDWTGPWRGRIGRHEALVGATAWTTGHGRSTERHHALFTLVRLDRCFGEEFPATSVTHLLRGFTDFDLALDPFESTELRLESIDVDFNCEIRVMGDVDDPRWRQLFDAPLVAALADVIDVQWCQRGRWLLCCAGGRRHGSAPVETLDTMCAGAEFVARWMDHVARGRSAGKLADGGTAA